MGGSPEGAGSDPNRVTGHGALPLICRPGSSLGTRTSRSDGPALRRSRRGVASTSLPRTPSSSTFSLVGPLAHRVEQGTFNPKVPGSSPGRPTVFPRDRWTDGPKWPLPRTTPGQRADPRCLLAGLAVSVLVQHAGRRGHAQRRLRPAPGTGAGDAVAVLEKPSRPLKCRRGDVWMSGRVVGEPFGQGWGGSCGLPGGRGGAAGGCRMAACWIPTICWYIACCVARDCC